MREVTVSKVCVTASTIEEFVRQMKCLAEHDLWDDAAAHLAERKKDFIWIDLEAIQILEEFLHCNCEHLEGVEERIKFLSDHT